MCECVAGALNVVARNRIDRASHPRCRLDDGGDSRGISSERMTNLEKLSLLGHANPARPTHGVLQLRLSPNQP
jgi:hypothetical protein